MWLGTDESGLDLSGGYTEKLLYGRMWIVKRKGIPLDSSIRFGRNVCHQIVGEDD